MRKRLATVVTAAAITFGAALPAAAAPPPFVGGGPADGQCVAAGVQTLDAATKSAVARGAVEGVPALNVVILDHAFNNADVTEGILGIEICP